MSEVQEVEEKEKTFKWKIGDFTKKKYHISPCFKVDGLRYNFLAESFSSQILEEKLWVFCLHMEQFLHPFYFTVSVVDHKGREFLTRKGKLEENLYSQRLIMFIEERYLIKLKIVERGGLTLLFTFENTLDAEKGQDRITDKVTDGLLEDLSNDFRSIYENNTGTDCVLRVRRTEFPVHRLVLSARSPVFAAMFYHDTSETRSGEVNIPDVDPSAFGDALYYVYTGKIRGLTSDTAVPMYTIADKYSLLQLRDKCLKSLVNQLTVENVCDAAVLAHNHGEATLEEKVVQFIGEKVEELQQTEKWKEFVKNNILLSSKLLCSALIAKGKSKK